MSDKNNKKYNRPKSDEWLRQDAQDHPWKYTAIWKDLLGIVLFFLIVWIILIQY